MFEFFLIAAILIATGKVVVWIADKQIEKEQRGEDSIDFKKDVRQW